MAGFIFGGNTGIKSPEELKRRRAVAEALAGETLGNTPRNLGEGIASIGKALAYRFMDKKNTAAETAGRESAKGAMSPIMAALLGGGGAASAPNDMAASPMDYASSRVAQAHSGAGDPTAYRDAIASIESQGSGDYSAMGPETNGDRAYGRYQVMGANIPSWTKESLGQEMTPEAFLASQEAQDKVFDHQFGKNVEKYGNPQDAASVWFTGRPQSQGAGATDVLGTSGSEYVNKFSDALGGQGNGVAQALARPPGQQTAQAGGPSPQMLMEALQNPWLDESQKGIVAALFKQQLEGNDPGNQLDMKYKQAQIDALGVKDDAWQKLDDDTLFNKNGETKELGSGKGGFRFGGSSVEAQSLNGLIDSGQLTPDQAQQLGAGKTISGPNGEVIFMTPQGVFGKPAGGGDAQPLNDGQPGGGQPSGNIQITEPKVTIDEKKAMTFADRMTTSGAIIDSMGMRGSGKADQLVSGVPVVGEYLTSSDFKKVDQAKRDFINAQLRRESGAVIADSEFDNANKQYFPQPNDPPELLEQKKRNRQTVIDGMTRDGGPTYAPAAKGSGDDGVVDWKDL